MSLSRSTVPIQSRPIGKLRGLSASNQSLPAPRGKNIQAQFSFADCLTNLQWSIPGLYSLSPMFVSFTNQWACHCLRWQTIPTTTTEFPSMWSRALRCTSLQPLISFIQRPTLFILVSSKLTNALALPDLPRQIFKAETSCFQSSLKPASKTSWKTS